MESEILYTFRDKNGIEISAWLNVERDTVTYWVSDPYDIKDYGLKQYKTPQEFTDMVNSEELEHTN